MGPLKKEHDVFLASKRKISHEVKSGILSILTLSNPARLRFSRFLRISLLVLPRQLLQYCSLSNPKTDTSVVHSPINYVIHLF